MYRMKFMFINFKVGNCPIIGVKPAETPTKMFTSKMVTSFLASFSW